MKKLFPTVLLAMALAGAALSTPASSYAASTAKPQAQTVPLAQLRIINASPDAPPLDVYVNGELVSRRVAYGAVTGYNMVKPGDARIQMVRAFRSLDRAPAIIDTTVKLDREKAYTVAASGMMAQIKPVLFNDDFDGPGKGKARLRLVHLSPGTPAVDVTGEPAGSSQSNQLVKNLANGKASPYVNVDAGEWNFNIQATGTTTSLLQLEERPVPEGQTVSVFLIGVTSGRPKLETISAIDGSATPSQVRVLHASPDAPAVDVYFDGNLQVKDAKYKDISNYLDLLPGEYRVQIVPAGKTLAEGPVVIDTTLNVEKGKVYAVAAAGMLASIKLVVAVDAGEQPPDGRGQVRVWHLSPDAPAVDVVTTEGPQVTLAKGLSFEKATPYVDLAPGTRAVAVQANGKTVYSTNLIVPANGTLTMYIMGLVKGSPQVEAVVSRDR